MFRNQGLYEKILGFHTHRYQIGDKIPGIGTEFLYIIGHGHGMIIHHTIKAPVPVLQLYPVFNCPEIIA
jgi:hypothetical protein